MKNLKMSLTKVRKYLKKVTFDPRKPGKMKVVAELEDSHYYERHAQFLIDEARYMRMDNRPKEDYDAKIVQAIQLLIMAGIVENG